MPIRTIPEARIAAGSGMQCRMPQDLEVPTLGNAGLKGLQGTDQPSQRIPIGGIFSPQSNECQAFAMTSTRQQFSA